MYRLRRIMFMSKEFGPNDSGLRKGQNRFRRLLSSEAEAVDRETNVVKSERQLAAEAKDAVTARRTARTGKPNEPIAEVSLQGSEASFGMNEGQSQA